MICPMKKIFVAEFLFGQNTNDLPNGNFRGNFLGVIPGERSENGRSFYGSAMCLKRRFRFYPGLCPPWGQESRPQGWESRPGGRLRACGSTVRSTFAIVHEDAYELGMAREIPAVSSDQRPEATAGVSMGRQCASDQRLRFICAPIYPFQN